MLELRWCVSLEGRLLWWIAVSIPRVLNQPQKCNVFKWITGKWMTSLELKEINICDLLGSFTCIKFTAWPIMRTCFHPKMVLIQHLRVALIVSLITLYLIGVRLCTRELLPILYIDVLWTKYMSVSQDCSFFLVKNEQMLESSLYN